MQCIQNNILVAMDNAIQDNNTWYLSDYVAIEPNPHNDFQSRDDGHSSFMGKLEDLVQSRHIQLSLNPLEEGTIWVIKISFEEKEKKNYSRQRKTKKEQTRRWYVFDEWSGSGSCGDSDGIRKNCICRSGRINFGKDSAFRVNNRKT